MKTRHVGREPCRLEVVIHMWEGGSRSIGKRTILYRCRQVLGSLQGRQEIKCKCLTTSFMPQGGQRNLPGSSPRLNSPRTCANGKATIARCSSPLLVSHCQRRASSLWADPRPTHGLRPAKNRGQGNFLPHAPSRRSHCLCVSTREQGDAGGNFKTPVEWPVLFICHSNPEKLPYAYQTATRHV